MSAVLARKQAEPIMAVLVLQGNELRSKLEANEDFPGKEEWTGYPARMPAPVARLTQCLVEEAEAAPETLIAALQLVAVFARGCRTVDDWTALMRGPYGEELLHQTWLIYAAMCIPADAWVINTFIEFAVRRSAAWKSEDGQAELRRLLSSQKIEETACGLATLAGLEFARPDDRVDAGSLQWVNIAEKHLLHQEPSLWALSTWAWALARKHAKGVTPPSSEVLDRLLSLLLSGAHDAAAARAGFALTTAALGLPRQAWRPQLTEAQVQKLRQLAKNTGTVEGAYVKAAGLIAAFHAGNVWPDEELAAQLAGSNINNLIGDEGTQIIAAMLEQMGEAGQKHVKSRTAT